MHRGDAEVAESQFRNRVTPVNGFRVLEPSW
jgi:hypothetical protein